MNKSLTIVPPATLRINDLLQGVAQLEERRIRTPEGEADQYSQREYLSNGSSLTALTSCRLLPRYWRLR